MSRYFEIKASEQSKCESCGRVVALEIYQLAHLVKDSEWVIYWESGYACNCGLVVEPQGLNQMPLELRQKLMGLHGTWQLDVGENPPQREKLLVILLEQKRRLGFETVQKLPPISGVIATGTFVEMKILELYLLDAGITTSISKVNQNQ